jgi:hypothetical protein
MNNKIESYKGVLRESIHNFIEYFFTKATLTTLKTAEKIAKQDSVMADRLEKLKSSYENIDQTIEDFCKKYPESELCKDLKKKN